MERDAPEADAETDGDGEESVDEAEASLQRLRNLTLEHSQREAKLQRQEMKVHEACSSKVCRSQWLRTSLSRDIATTRLINCCGQHV